MPNGLNISTYFLSMHNSILLQSRIPYTDNTGKWVIQIFFVSILLSLQYFFNLSNNLLKFGKFMYSVGTLSMNDKVLLFNKSNRESHSLCVSGM